MDRGGIIQSGVHDEGLTSLHLSPSLNRRPRRLEALVEISSQWDQSLKPRQNVSRHDKTLKNIIVGLPQALGNVGKTQDIKKKTTSCLGSPSPSIRLTNMAASLKTSRHEKKPSSREKKKVSSRKRVQLFRGPLCLYVFSRPISCVCVSPLLVCIEHVLGVFKVFPRLPGIVLGWPAGPLDEEALLPTDILMLHNIFHFPFFLIIN